jgi:hypothetical protein
MNMALLESLQNILVCVKFRFYVGIDSFWFRKYFRSDERKVFERIRKEFRKEKSKSVPPSMKKDSVVFGWDFSEDKVFMKKVTFLI